MPLLASDIQPSDDMARTLAQRRERRVRAAIATALTALAGLLTGSAVLALIARYDAAGLLRAATTDTGRTLIAGYQPIADVLAEAARTAANENFAGQVVYDPLAASETQAGLRSAFMAAIRQSQGAVLRLVLLDGVRNGLDAGTIQATLQQVIGLTPQQAQAVLNFRRMLQAGDRAVLTRTLRDRRFDGAVTRALNGGDALGNDQIDAMVARYAARSLAHRAETIARTETMQAAVSGIRDAYVQAVDTGQLYDSEVKRFWLVCADERTCPVCTSVPLMNLGGIGVKAAYASIIGPILAPLAHPVCRCSERYEANLTRLTGQPFAAAA